MSFTEGNAALRVENDQGSVKVPARKPGRLTRSSEETTPSLADSGDWMSPVQFSRPQLVRSAPERRLMLAVLENGIATYLRWRDAKSHRPRQLAKAARAWIERPEKNSLYSFERICETFDFDPQVLRRRLLAPTNDAALATPKATSTRAVIRTAPQATKARKKRPKQRKKRG